MAMIDPPPSPAAKTDAGVVADLVRKHIKPQVMNLASPDLAYAVPVLVLPSGLQAVGVEQFVAPYRDAPKRMKGTAKLETLDSLVAWVDRFKDSQSALFADSSVPRLLAVIDYNRGNVDDVVTDSIVTSRVSMPSPRFGEHRGAYAFPLSAEWKAWTANSGSWMKQAEFAEFIDDRVLDIAAPDGAFSNAEQFKATLGITSFASPSRLMALSRGLTVHVDDRTTCRIDPSSGETTLNFEVSHSDADGAPLAVPRAFILQIPVFEDGVAYRLPVRLKYRAGGGSVSWSYEIHNPDRAFDDAFREACGDAASRTGVPLYYGTPES